LGDRVRDVYVNAGGLLANQRLAGDLQKDAAEGRRRFVRLITHLLMPGKPRSLLAGELGDFALEIVAAFLNAFAHFVTREAADRDLLAGLGDFLGDQLADGFLFFLDERLIQKHGLFEKLVEAAFDNLIDYIVRLAPVLRIVL